MVTMPWVLLAGGVVFLGLKWGDWKFLPVLAATVFGLVLASTGAGGELTTWMQTGTQDLIARIAEAAK